jgi:hypothetical protein
VRVVEHVRSVSADLASLFRSGQEARTPFANDTSFAIGNAPLDTLEATPLSVSSALSSQETRAVHPAIGADIKLTGVRERAEFSLRCASCLLLMQLRKLIVFGSYLLVALGNPFAVSAQLRVGRPADTIRLSHLLVTAHLLASFPRLRGVTGQASWPFR